MCECEKKPIQVGIKLRAYGSAYNNGSECCILIIIWTKPSLATEQSVYNIGKKSMLHVEGKSFKSQYVGACYLI